MKNRLFLLCLICLLPCRTFAQKDAAITRSLILSDKDQSVTIPSVLPEFTDNMKFYSIYLKNGAFQRHLDLLPSVKKQAVSTKDSTEAVRLFKFCLNNISSPEIPAKYISFKNAANVNEYCLEYTPVVSMTVVVKDAAMGLERTFIIAENMKMSFYCGINKEGTPKLSDLESIKKGENIRGATSPESFDYILDNTAQGIHRELMIKEISSTISGKMDKAKNLLLKSLYDPKVINGQGFKMHVLSNKKALEDHPDIDELNKQSKELFVAWATNQNDTNLKSQLANIAQKYIEIGDKELGKNISLMCYSNAALALAMTEDYAASATCEAKAQSFYKPFGTIVGEAIPSIYNQFKLSDMIKNQNTIKIQ